MLIVFKYQTNPCAWYFRCLYNFRVSDESQISATFSDEQKSFFIKEYILKEYRENMDVRNSEIIKNF